MTKLLLSNINNKGLIKLKEKRRKETNWIKNKTNWLSTIINEQIIYYIKMLVYNEIDNNIEVQK